jgi:hypothetical protein
MGAPSGEVVMPLSQDTANMGPEYTIRTANCADLDTLVAFTLEEAQESEDVEKDVDAVRRGIM